MQLMAPHAPSSVGTKITIWFALVRYRRSLVRMAKFLSRYRESKWSGVLQGWRSELDGISLSRSGLDTLRRHAARTKRVFGGMGSLNDVAISPMAGHKIPTDREIRRKVNRNLSELRGQLFEATNNFLSVLPDA